MLTQMPMRSQEHDNAFIVLVRAVCDPSIKTLEIDLIQQEWMECFNHI